MRYTFGLALLALFVLARAAMAQPPGTPWVDRPDHETGVPLSPAEAAGAWTLESHGRAICMVRLSADHGASPSQDCAGALPGAVSGWRPTSDGMALTDGSGQQVLAFSRWSNSLFVSTRSSGTDLQLMRGSPHPEGQY
jgi:hypothetical protein